MLAGPVIKRLPASAVMLLVMPPLDASGESSGLVRDADLLD
jgi:hypothetical protein